MSFRIALRGLLYLCLFLPAAAFAGTAVLSGSFDGSEPKTAPLPGTCLGTDPLGYQQAGSFQVSVSGLYAILDAYNIIGVDISALIYSGSFDVNAPLANLVTPDGVDVATDSQSECRDELHSRRSAMVFEPGTGVGKPAGGLGCRTVRTRRDHFGPQGERYRQ